MGMHWMPRRQLRCVIARRDGWNCYYCRTTLTAYTSTIDHVVPTKMGGTNALRNLRLACARCNQRKADKPPHAFINEMMQGVA